MKKVLLSFATVVLLFAACKKDDKKGTPTPDNNGTNNPPVSQEIVVPQKNVALVNKLTGSLCGPCGSWGWSAFEQIMNESDSNAIYMGTYSQNFVAQLFITQTATDMDGNFGNSGYPTFCVGGVQMVDRPGGGVNTTSEIAKVKTAVAAHVSGEVFANSGFKTSIDKDVMTIETKTKFFKDVSGDLYLAAYVMEDKVKGFQQSHPDGNNTLHHQVLRGAAQLNGSPKAESFGYKINTDAMTEGGTTLENKFTMNIAGFNKDNLSVAVIIWRKVGVRYKYINGYTNQKLK